MPTYSYKARDNQDQMMTGTMGGRTVNEVVDRLEQKNLVVITIEELNFDGSSKTRSFVQNLTDGFRRIRGDREKAPYKSVVFFTRQLATMISGGVAITRALDQLAQDEKSSLRNIIAKVQEDISTGFSFSDAVARHPRIFNNMFVAIIRSGEMTGALSEVLDQLATYMENIEMLKSKVKTAMRYPIFIGGFISLLVFGILWKLVPVFQGLYAGFGAKLPGPTLLLVSISDLIRHNIALVIVCVALLVVGYKMAMANEQCKGFFDRLVLKIPILGNILYKNILAVFCRTMALLTKSGTPILQAIEISGVVVNNKMYSSALEDVYNRVRAGEVLSAALAATHSFPALVVQLVSTGEHSGKMDELLRKAAEFYEREVRNVVDSLSTIIEPILIIVMGAIVGGILIALYLPVFMIGQYILGGTGTH